MTVTIIHAGVQFSLVPSQQDPNATLVRAKYADGTGSSVNLRASDELRITGAVAECVKRLMYPGHKVSDNSVRPIVDEVVCKLLHAAVVGS